MPVRIFVSYSQSDRLYLGYLRDHLAPLVDAGQLDLWSDEKVRIGDDWHATIQEALDQSHAAVILVSPKYLASRYVKDHEINKILESRVKKGFRVFPVLVSHCDYQAKLAAIKFAMLGYELKPLVGLRRDRRDLLLRDLTREIKLALDAVTPPTPPDHASPERQAVTSPTPSPTPPPETRVDDRDRVRDRIQRLLRELARIEGETSVLLREIEKELRPDARDDHDLPPGEDPTPSIVEALVDNGSFTVLSPLNGFYDELCTAKRWKPADIFYEMIEVLAPFHFGSSLSSQNRHKIMVEQNSLFFAPVQRAAALEPLLARRDGKEMRHNEPKDRLPVEDIGGKASFCLKNPAFDGPLDAERLAKLILLDLCEQGGMPDSSGELTTLIQLIDRFRAVLRNKATRENRGRTLYYFHMMPQDSTKEIIHRDALQLLWSEFQKAKQVGHQRLPELLFVVLAKTSEVEEEESLIVTVLNTRFLHQRNRTSHDSTGS